MKIIAKRNFRGILSFVAQFPNRRPSGRVSPTGSAGRNANWSADIWKNGGRSCANCAWPRSWRNRNSWPRVTIARWKRWPGDRRDCRWRARGKWWMTRPWRRAGSRRADSGRRRNLKWFTRSNWKSYKRMWTR